MTPPSSDVASRQSASSHADAKANLDHLAIDTIRTLAMDAVQKANSGHPGTPMAHGAGGLHALDALPALRSGRAGLAQPRPLRALGRPCLACCSMRCCTWPASSGSTRTAGSSASRPSASTTSRPSAQLDSVCPGHPEYGHTTGVETTTGPLGQGCGNSVGMAIAERWLASRFNRPGRKLFDYNVYALCSDGDMMEGVASEAASIAGHLKLSNLCWIYDDNTITIEGHTELAFSEDVAERFRGYGWATLRVDDANDCEAFARAIETLQGDRRPADPDRGQERHRLWLAAQAGHRRSPRRAAGRGGGPADQGRPTAGREDAQFLVPDGVNERFAGALRERGGQAARRAGRRRFERLSPRHSRARPSELKPHVGRRACRTAGTRTSRPSPPTPRASPRATPPARC